MALQIISSVLSAASSYDLTDLATVKDELSIPSADTTKDAFLGRAITQISTLVGNYCNRIFNQETVQDFIYPERDAYPYQVPGTLRVLQLSRYPVADAVVTLSTSGNTASGATLPFTSTAGVAAGQPVSGTNIPAGAYVLSLVPNTSVTLSANIAGAVPAATAITFGVAVTVTDTSGNVSQLVPGIDFLINGKAGQLTRLNKYTAYPDVWSPLTTAVAYQGGFATIPADVVSAVLREVTQRFMMRGHNPLLKSQSQPGLGTQSYWVGTVPGVKGIFTEEVAGILDNYAVPVVA